MDPTQLLQSSSRFYEEVIFQNGSISSSIIATNIPGEQPLRTERSLKAQEQWLYCSGLKQGFGFGAAFKSQHSRLMII